MTKSCARLLLPQRRRRDKVCVEKSPRTSEVERGKTVELLVVKGRRFFSVPRLKSVAALGVVINSDGRPTD